MLRNVRTGAPAATDHRSGYCGTGCRCARRTTAAIRPLSTVSTGLSTPGRAADNDSALRVRSTGPSAVDDTRRPARVPGTARQPTSESQGASSRTGLRARRGATRRERRGRLPDTSGSRSADPVKHCGAASYDRCRRCDTFHWERRGLAVEHPVQAAMMAAPSFESHPSSRISPWSASTCDRSYLIAALRAGVIAVVLLGILALLILF